MTLIPAKPMLRNSNMRLPVDLLNNLERVLVKARILQKVNKTELTADCIKRGLLQVEAELELLEQQEGKPCTRQ